MSDVIERVTRGAEWLDENQPGWEERVDLATLDLNHACRCVLGQVMPERDYYVTVGQLLDRGVVTFGWGFSHGFNARPDEPITIMGELDEAWIALIKERHSSGNLSGLR